MKDKLEQIVKNIDALTLRERLFVCAAALAVVAGLWEALLAGPLAAREQLASNAVEAASARIGQLNESITLTAQGMSDGMPNQLERLTALRERVVEGEESMRIFTSDLVTPDQMRFLLEDLLQRQRGLQLVSVSNLESRPVIEAEDGQQTETAGPRLFRHGLVLVLEGSYLDCLNYLQAVERLPWQLYWARLDLETDNHPRNRIVIELHTLSLEEEWIGV